MNDRQKTVIIIGFVLILLCCAQQLLFVQNAKNRLMAAQADYALTDFFLSVPRDETIDESQRITDRIVDLEKDLSLARALQFVFAALGGAFIVSACFFRSPKSGCDEEEWEEDDWDDDV